MGLRAGLDRSGKSRSPLRFDPQTVQPLGSRYADYATRPTCEILSRDKNARLLSIYNSYFNNFYHTGILFETNEDKPATPYHTTHVR